MSTKAKGNRIDATEVRLYVAEDFREEANHKVTAVGLYTDHRIVLQIPASQLDPTPENPAAFRSLCFLFNISRAPQGAKVSIDLEGPGNTGVVVPEQMLTVSRLAAAASFIIRMEPCIVTALGTRTFVVKVNLRKFTFDWVIDRQEAAHPQAVDSPSPMKVASKSRSKRAVAKATP